MNKQIDSNFGTETHHLRQTKEHSKMIKEWMPQPIPTKAPSENVNPDSTNIQKQQMDFSKETITLHLTRKIYTEHKSQN